MRPSVFHHPRPNPSARTVRVNEVYLSLQGESSHQGLLCAFVRLTGCHLRCTYCDSTFTFYEGKHRNIDDVVSEVRALGAPRVEITGGEPLLQPGVYPLMQRLLDAGLVVLLETSGAIDIRDVPRAVRKIVDLKTPSSGEVSRNCYDNLSLMAPHDELKFVLGSREDYDWAVARLHAYGLSSRPFEILFSCVWDALSPQQLAEWIIADRLPVRFQLQQHKYVWPPHQRGV